MSFLFILASCFFSCIYDPPINLFSTQVFSYSIPSIPPLSCLSFSPSRCCFPSLLSFPSSSLSHCSIIYPGLFLFHSFYPCLSCLPFLSILTLLPFIAVIPLSMSYTSSSILSHPIVSPNHLLNKINSPPPPHLYIPLLSFPCPRPECNTINTWSK